MPGMPSHFKILELTLAKMSGQSDLDAVRQTIADHPEWAHLGAIGPALADFMPVSSKNPYITIWATVFSLMGDGIIKGVDKGLLSVLRDIRQALNEIEPILVSEDLDALKALGQAKLDVVKNTGGLLQTIFQKIPGVAETVGLNILVFSRPKVSNPTGKIPQSDFWALRDYLYWKRPGAFTKRLLETMAAGGDPRFLAYAYGYAVSYVANVVGGPFVGSVARGPYRTRWWRHRWVNNYVDAWVWGKYESGATLEGDKPSPPYDTWPSLCDAGLHQRIALGDHDPIALMKKLNSGDALSDTLFLPEQFGQLWAHAFDETYGAKGSVKEFVTPENLNDAYLMAWLVLWFQTAADSVGCLAPPPTPPGDCGAEPAWVSPKVKPKDEGGVPDIPVPEAPQIDIGGSKSKTACGIILLIAGAGLLASGNLAAGGAAFAAGLEALADGLPSVNWAQLRCYLFWYKLYLNHALSALHEVFTVAALRFPAAADLGHDTTLTEFFPGLLPPYNSGVNVTKSVGSNDPSRSEYPATRWTPVLPEKDATPEEKAEKTFDWLRPPDTFENKRRVVYRVNAYPSFFVDDAANNPLANGNVRDASPADWPIKVQPGSPSAEAGGLPVQFGNAVDNAIDLFRNLGSDLPDWNLDADRGMAHLTWEFTNALYSDPVGTSPES